MLRSIVEQAMGVIKSIEFNFWDKVLQKRPESHIGQENSRLIKYTSRFPYSDHDAKTSITYDGTFFSYNGRCPETNITYGTMGKLVLGFDDNVVLQTTHKITFNNLTT